VLGCAREVGPSPRRSALVVVTLLTMVVATLVIAPRAGAFVYWANAGPTFHGTTIGRANLNGTAVNQSFITGANGPCGVAVDGTHIYWGNSALGAGVPSAGTIGRANLNGTGVNQFLTSVPDNPCGVAVDGTHVYWGDPDRTTVGRANLNGSAANPDFIPSVACGVAVDDSHIYWSNSGSTSVGRANLNGTGVDATFINGADHPCGVAVDGAHIYWANSSSSVDGSTIGRANLNGTGVDQSFITGGHGVCGLAVSASQIYWGNFATDTIGRATLDGATVRQNFITGANAPCGVAVDASGTKALLNLTTQASRSVKIGGAVRDNAKLTGGFAPRGQIVFRAYGPGNANCSGNPAFGGPVTVTGNGAYSSARFVPKRAGTYRFRAIYSGDARNARFTSACNAAHESVFVKKATPKLSTRASLLSGNLVGDAASLTGGHKPAGKITFQLYGPGDSNCSKKPVFTDRISVSGNAHYHSHRFTAGDPGTYRFTAAYTGDANNKPASSPCNAAGESVTVGG
jgi:virginiamycin B lyase